MIANTCSDVMPSLPKWAGRVTLMHVITCSKNTAGKPSGTAPGVRQARRTEDCYPRGRKPYSTGKPVGTAPGVRQMRRIRIASPFAGDALRVRRFFVFRPLTLPRSSPMSQPIKDSYLPVRLPAAQAQTVKALAAQSNTTASDIVRRAIGLLVSAQVSQPSPQRHEP